MRTAAVGRLEPLARERRSIVSTDREWLQKGHDKPRPAAGDDRHFRKDRPRPDSSLPAPGPPAPPLQVNSPVGSPRAELMVDKPEVCVFCARQQIVPMTTRTW